MSNEIKWFSFPFVAPKGKGSKPPPAEGPIEEVAPPEELLPRKPWDDPLRLTPKERRRRIIELLAAGLRRLISKSDGRP